MSGAWLEAFLVGYPVDFVGLKDFKLRFKNFEGFKFF
jgi:hypothetical protein